MKYVNRFSKTYIDRGRIQQHINTHVVTRVQMPIQQSPVINRATFNVFFLFSYYFIQKQTNALLQVTLATKEIIFDFFLGQLHWYEFCSFFAYRKRLVNKQKYAEIIVMTKTKSKYFRRKFSFELNLITDKHMVSFIL